MHPAWTQSGSGRTSQRDASIPGSRSTPSRPRNTCRRRRVCRPSPLAVALFPVFHGGCYLGRNGGEHWTNPVGHWSESVRSAHAGHCARSLHAAPRRARDVGDTHKPCGAWTSRRGVGPAALFLHPDRTGSPKVRGVSGHGPQWRSSLRSIFTPGTPVIRWRVRRGWNRCCPIKCPVWTDRTPPNPPSSRAAAPPGPAGCLLGGPTTFFS